LAAWWASSACAALAVAGVILSPALLLNGRAIRHGGVEPALEEAGKAKRAPKYCLDLLMWPERELLPVTVLCKHG
jgi:hypothetical protein